VVGWSDAPPGLFGGLFKWRQFEPEVILLAIGWYLRFSLSYRDVEELLAERGLSVDHVTVWRWVQRYAPELERRLRRNLKPTNDSWRVDETYVRVKGKWVYLYRAVDSSGATIDFLLSAKRGAATAQRFLTKALGGENHPDRGPSTATSTPLIHPPLPCSNPQVIRPTTANTAPCSISITSWNRITGRSSVESTNQREPAFPLVPVCLAHHRRLRSDSYDSQRPGVRECVGCEGRSSSPLHSRSVRGDELNSQSSTPNLRLDYKVATHPEKDQVNVVRRTGVFRRGPEGCDENGPAAALLVG
jgi:DDE domain